MVNRMYLLGQYYAPIDGATMYDVHVLLFLNVMYVLWFVFAEDGLISREELMPKYAQ